MLKSEINDPVWFFDLEWVPDAAGAIRLYGLPQDTSERDAMQRLWEETKGYDPAACPRPFVKYALSRVVSISFLSRRITYVDGVRKVEFGLHSLPKLPMDVGEVPTEAGIISQFLHWVGIREPQLVGFNSLDSDLQVLIQRSLVNEVRAEAFCKRADAPWRGRDYFDSKNSEWHLDLIQRFSRGAMRPGLNELARLSGFPGKIDVNGDQVVDMWLDGRLQEIVEYNQIDTLNTYLLWLRVANFSCKVREDHYVEEQDDFREFLEMEAEKPAGGHIQKFLDAWDSIV
jgi:3'-5' exonuclease